MRPSYHCDERDDSETKMTSSLLIFAWSLFTTINTASYFSSYLNLGHSLLITKKECRERHFVQYGKECLRTCPPKTHFFADDNKCYDLCPLMSIQTDGKCLNVTFCEQQKQVLVNGSCQDECPKINPYKKDSYCYKECPKESVLNGTECIGVNNCINSSYIFNDICVSSCPSNKTYSVNGVCRANCPNGTVTIGNTTKCRPVTVCTDKALVAYNKTCVPFCPPHTPYIAKGECFHSCPKSFVLLNSTNCIASTECTMKHWFVFNGTCVADCPTNMYQYYIKNIHVCSSSCFKGFVILNETCISENECTSPLRLYSVVYNGSCLSGCPIEAPLNNNGYCTDACPETMFEKDSLCKDNNLCRNYFNLEYNGKSVRSCPKEAPYRKAGFLNSPDYCIECPYLKGHDDMGCITATKCISEHKYVYRRTCYDSCPEGTFSYTNFQCYIKCPTDTIANDSRCIPRKECQFIDNDRCVSACPITRQFVHNTLCLAECPRGTVANKSKCIAREECKLIFNGSCVSTCPLGRQVVYHNTCSLQCPDNTFLNGTICQDLAKCPKVVYNGTCVDMCPESSPLLDLKQCVPKCQAGSKAFRDSKCVLLSKCKKFSNGSIIENKNTCLTTCPETLPYTYKFKDICLSKCPPHTFVKETDCIEEYDCRGVKYKGRCMMSCPSEAPYKHFDKCRNECPDDMFVKDKQCAWKTNCPNLIFNRTCIYRGDCPGEFKYRKDNMCLKVCPEVIDVDGIKCIDSYTCTSKGHLIIDEKACVPSCPVGYAYAETSCIKQRYVPAGIAIVSVLALATYATLYLLLHNPSNETRHGNVVYTKIENDEDDSEEVIQREERPRRRGATIDFHRELEDRTFLEEDPGTSFELNSRDCRERDDRRLELDRIGRTNQKEVIIKVDERPQSDHIASVEVHRQQSSEDVPLLEVHRADDDFDNDAQLFGNG